MRLNDKARAEATEELLGILAENPSGLSTSELSGTPRFHGSRTLSNAQIIKLLRASGQVTEELTGVAYCRFLLWRLTNEPGNEVLCPIL